MSKKKKSKSVDKNVGLRGTKDFSKMYTEENKRKSVHTLSDLELTQLENFPSSKTEQVILKDGGKPVDVEIINNLKPVNKEKEINKLDKANRYIDDIIVGLIERLELHDKDKREYEQKQRGRIRTKTANISQICKFMGQSTTYESYAYPILRFLITVGFIESIRKRLSTTEKTQYDDYERKIKKIKEKKKPSEMDKKDQKKFERFLGSMHSGQRPCFYATPKCVDYKRIFQDESESTNIINRYKDDVFTLLYIIDMLSSSNFSTVPDSSVQ